MCKRITSFPASLILQVAHRYCMTQQCMTKKILLITQRTHPLVSLLISVLRQAQGGRIQILGLTTL